MTEKFDGFTIKQVNAFQPVQHILNKLEYNEWFELYDFFEQLFQNKNKIEEVK